MINGLTAQQLTRLAGEMQNLSIRVMEALITLQDDRNSQDIAVAHVKREAWGRPLLYMGLTSDEVRVLALPPPPPPPTQDAV